MGHRKAGDPRMVYLRFRDGAWKEERSEIGALAGDSSELFGVLGEVDPEVVCKVGGICLVKSRQGWKEVNATIPPSAVVRVFHGKGWALTPFPVAFTLQYYERVIVETPKYIVNSFLYSGIAVALCIAVGVPIAWLLARSTVPGRGALDAVNTLILAIPGTAIGIAYLRAFHFELPGFDRGLTSFWIIMPLVLAVRRLPYTVRGAYASLSLVHRSMEEAAASVGATGLRSFRDITLPLIWKGVLVGSLFSFMTSLQEASAVLFLALGGWESITNGIFAFYIAGSANEAAALGVILILVAAVTTIVVNWIADARMGGVFG